MTKKHLRLKDLENIVGESVDYVIMMKEIFGYKNRFFFKKKHFIKYVNKVNELVSEARNIDISKIGYIEGCAIKKPHNIDNISFMAMMELQSLMSNYNEDDDFGKHIAKVISIVCYGEHYKNDYSSNNNNFKEFEMKVLNSPIWQMVGLYNWINKSLKDSSKNWSERFLSVQLEDKDYEQAGGSRMNQFNIINTIKNICTDFNLTYKQAWQISYSLSQTNNYSKASANFTQDQMRIIKELRMKSNKA